MAGVTFKKEIIERVAERRGLPAREVAELIELHLDFIKNEIANDPEVTDIRLRGVGTLKASKTMLREEIRINSKPKNEEFKESVEKIAKPRLEKIERLIREKDNAYGTLRRRYWAKPFVFLARKKLKQITGKQQLREGWRRQYKIWLRYHKYEIKVVEDEKNN